MMQSKTFALLTLCLVSTISVKATQSSSSPNNNHYCVNRHISFDPNSFQIEGETESIINFYESDQEEVQNVSSTAASSLSSSTTHSSSNKNHGVTPAVVNNIAMFFHAATTGNQYHPEQQQHVSPFVAMDQGSFISYLQDNAQEFFDEYYYDESHDDEDEDDDDDDDNDGHSSMLSNASIVRKRVVMTTGGNNGSGDNTFGFNGNNIQSRKHNNRGLKSSTFSLLSNHRRRNTQSSSSFQSSFGLNQALNVRGGASASSAADVFAKRLIAAATVTVLYEATIGHILEFLKIAMQTAPVGSATYTSIIRSITQEKGLFGLWDGFIPWGVVQSIFKGGVFGLAHAMAKAYLKPLVESGVLPEQFALTLAGGIAGGFQGFVLSPLLLLKTRVMTNPVFREKMSLLRTTLLSCTIGFEVVRNEGILALMKGADIFALKRVFDWATRYYFLDVFQTIMLKSGAGINGILSTGEKIMASLLAGFASTVVTLPLDVIVAKAQDAKKASVKVSAWETFMKDYKEGGMKGLYDANMMGFEARLLHVSFTTVVMQYGSPIMFNLLFGNKK